MLHLAIIRRWAAGLVAASLVWLGSTLGDQAVRVVAAEGVQYEFGDVRIPAASAEEPKRSELSVSLALQHLEEGAVAWSGQRKCVTCHTNGTYMVVRPALSASLGKPPEATWEFFRKTLVSLQAEERSSLRRSTKPAQVIYVAAGLAEWDAHVTGKLLPETEQALALMFEIQEETGTWGTLDCWPPYESDAYHEATVAAMAAATAPGYLTKVAESDNEMLKKAVERLQNYLRTQPPLHDYSRILLLWARSRWPNLIDAARQAELIDVVRKHQREDGGWSIRTFAAPEAWGRGNRAAKLRSEPDFETPASDGHMTGLAVVALRSAGVPASDPAVTRGIAWIKTNQRVSGRWWTRSLNTDSWHFITYSGTAFPLLALDLCGEIKANP